MACHLRDDDKGTNVGMASTHRVFLVNFLRFREGSISGPSLCMLLNTSPLDTHDSPAKWEAFLAGTERYTGNQGREDRDVGWVPEILKIRSWHEF